MSPLDPQAPRNGISGRSRSRSGSADNRFWREQGSRATGELSMFRGRVKLHLRAYLCAPSRSHHAFFSYDVRPDALLGM